MAKITPGSLALAREAKIKRLKKTKLRVEKSLNKQLIEQQLIDVGESFRSGRRYRKFSTQAKLEILKAYNKLKNRMEKTKFLELNELTTAHICIWRKALRDGRLVD